MRKKKVEVLYRENCGGILRDLASGFGKTVKSLADCDLYDDLRERIFRKDNSIHEEEQQKLSA